MLPPDFGGRDFNSWKKRAGNSTGEPVRFPKHVLQMKEGSFENKEEARQWNPALSEADRQVRRHIGQSRVRWIAIPSLSYHCEEEIDGAEPEYFVCGTNLQFQDEW